MVNQSFSGQVIVDDKVIKINDTQNAEKKFESIEPQLRGKEPKGQLPGIPRPEKTVGFDDGNVKNRIKNLTLETQKMFEALCVNDLRTVREQLDKGVSADSKNDVGQTPLHATQDLAILKLLISSGADVNSSDSDGRTPIFNKEIELIKVLIVAGADIHHRSNKGNTLLIWYSYSGYLKGIQYIVSLGADVNVMNIDGQTAHDIAERFAHFKLLEYLISIGAQPGKQRSN